MVGLGTLGGMSRSVLGGVSRRFRRQILLRVHYCAGFGSWPVGRLIRLPDVRAMRLSKRLRVIGVPHTGIDLVTLLADLDF